MDHGVPQLRVDMAQTDIKRGNLTEGRVEGGSGGGTEGKRPWRVGERGSEGGDGYKRRGMN